MPGLLQDCFVREHTAAVAHVMGPAQDQSSQHSGMEWGTGDERLSLAEELFTTDGILGRETQFSLKHCPSPLYFTIVNVLHPAAYR